MSGSKDTKNATQPYKGMTSSIILRKWLTPGNKKERYHVLISGRIEMES